MVLIEGKGIKEKILSDIKKEIDKNNYKIALAIISIGENDASNIYINQKRKMAEYLNINFLHIKFDNNTLEEDIISKIKELNNDKDIHGILVQLPISSKYNKNKIIDTIDYRKDIDGLNIINRNKLLNNKECFIPCAVLGIMNLFKYYNISLNNKKIVILGKSILVGFPLYTILKNRGLDVTICDSKTTNIDVITKKADILISAIGKANYIKKDMIKEGSIIIDVGTNKINDKIYGDVDFNDVKDKVSMITPSKGGVGPMTICSLAINLYRAYEINNGKEGNNI